MKNKKILVAGGCSFTFEDWNWPGYVASNYGLTVHNVGMGSMGNRLISRRTIAKTEQLLQQYKPEEIIVGVMWSGLDRMDTWVAHDDIPTPDETAKLGYYENPVHISDENYKQFWMMNMHWSDSKSLAKYKTTNEVDNLISTITDILFTQYYLKSKGIDYFMTTYLSIFTGNGYWKEEDSPLTIPDAKFFYEMIDQSKFLKENCNDWCWANQNEPGHYVWRENDDDDHPVGHPVPLGHQKYAENIIIPFIDKHYG